MSIQTRRISGTQTARAAAESRSRGTQRHPTPTHPVRYDRTFTAEARAQTRSCLLKKKKNYYHYVGMGYKRRVLKKKNKNQVRRKKHALECIRPLINYETPTTLFFSSPAALALEACQGLRTTPRTAEPSTRRPRTHRACGTRCPLTPPSR